MAGAERSFLGILPARIKPVVCRLSSLRRRIALGCNRNYDGQFFEGDWVVEVSECATFASNSPDASPLLFIYKGKKTMKYLKKNAVKTFLFVLLLCISWTICVILTKNRLFVAKPSNPISYGEFPPHYSWVFETRDTVVSSLVSQDGVVFVRTQHSIYALSASNGEKIWEADTESELSLIIAPQIKGEYVIVPEKKSGIAAFSYSTGDLIWRVPPMDISKTHLTSTSIESMALNNDTVYVARFGSPLAAYDIKSGSLLWEKKITGRTFPYIVSNDRNLYLGLGLDAILMQIDAKTGNIISRKKIGGYLGPMTLSNDNLFVSDVENNIVYAVNGKTVENEILWSQDLPADISPYKINNLVVYDNCLYISADRLLKLSIDNGQLIWATQKTKALESPVILKDTIFVRNIQNDLYAFDLQSGLETGKLFVIANTVMNHAPFRSPIIEGDLVIIPFGDNRIFAYHP